MSWTELGRDKIGSSSLCFRVCLLLNTSALLFKRCSEEITGILAVAFNPAIIIVCEMESLDFFTR